MSARGSQEVFRGENDPSAACKRSLRNVGGAVIPVTGTPREVGPGMMTTQPASSTSIAMSSAELAARMKDTILHVDAIDATAGRVLRTAVGRLGWRRLLEAPTSEVVAMFRRHYGERGVEFSEVVARVRRGEAPAVIAAETTSRWMKHWVWERESRASRLARPPWWPAPPREPNRYTSFAEGGMS